MSVSDHADERCTRSERRAAPVHRAASDRCADPRTLYPAEAEVLARLPDSDFLGALCELPDDLRLAVYLADIAGYRYREIAEIMGTPVGTVTARLHRARRSVRGKLAACAVLRGLAAAPG